jgi:hypothetical protein
LGCYSSIIRTDRRQTAEYRIKNTEREKQKIAVEKGFGLGRIGKQFKNQNVKGKNAKLPVTQKNRNGAGEYASGAQKEEKWMTFQFDRLMDAIAIQYAERGEGTGSASKILSGLTFPILTILAVQFIKDHQYIPLLLIATLIWTRFNLVIMLCGLIYFVVTKYWIGAGILIVYFIVTTLSIHFGTRNIKRLLISGKPMISPFEGMTDLLLILVFECLFLALALFTHGWSRIMFWCLFGIVALDHLRRYWFRLYPRWSQIHHPLMIRYAACAGFEAGLAKRENRDFDFFTATKSLLKSIYPNKQDEEIESILVSAADKMDTFSDRDLLTRTIHQRKRSVPQNTVDELLKKIEGHLQTDEGRKLIVRYVIAEIVESVFGIDERGGYLLAVIEGRAK